MFILAMGNAEDIDAYQLSNTHWIAFCTGRNCRLTHLQGAKAKWSATLTLRLTFLGGAGTVTGSKFLVEHGDRTPVLVDDIISSGRTMLEAIRLLSSRGWALRRVLPCMDYLRIRRTLSSPGPAHA